jgi:glyoxylase-like metal-dependent hydrolase (beta-lactamase superfamily II)/lambda repressor-like predicted transcriptional regulator
MPNAIDLEDFAEDIIGKAIRGLGLSIRQLADASGVSSGAIDNLLKGNFDEADARAVAPHLGLSPDALADSGNSAWRPNQIQLRGLAMFNTPWRDMRVNAYLVWDPSTKAAAAFDTGADASGMIAFAEENDLDVGAVYLTHTHGDHIAELDRVLDAFGGPHAFVSELEPVAGAAPIDPDHTSQIGALSLETRHTWGHSPGGHTYLIGGLDRPVAIVGDALFAGSMGGGVVSYPDALATNRAHLFTLPDNTVVCPGHGPLSSIGEERRHNPFFAADFS